jgi:hypothetical protein
VYLGRQQLLQPCLWLEALQQENMWIHAPSHQLLGVADVVVKTIAAAA